MKLIRTLHLASFDGNIGDNANHSGFYSFLKKNEKYSFLIDQLEIREFYWKKRCFDQSFVDLANQYDLLIIGGGNYFELWVEHSPTGCSIMIEPELFKMIRVPVLFNALGVDPAQGASESCCSKFRNFLDIVLGDHKNLVSVRNDGSLQALKDHIGDKYSSLVLWTPDAGAFVSTSLDHPFIDTSKKYIAVNIAGDMLDSRFSNQQGEISEEDFVAAFAALIVDMINRQVCDEFIFVPHIYKDLAVIGSILSKLPDSLVRTHINIAPLLHGMGSEKLMFSIYKNAAISLSMRFHANLCSVGLGTPTVALVNYRQIRKLYEEMGLSKYAIEVSRPAFDERLGQLVSSIVEDYASHQQMFIDKAFEMRQQYQNYMANVFKWCDSVFSSLEKQ